jgi:hypothetical protein
VVIRGGDKSDGFTNSLEKTNEYIIITAKSRHFRHRIPPHHHGKGAVVEPAE